MTRSTPEWIGKTDDTAIPPRVKARVMEKQGGKCCFCNRKLGMAGEVIEFDHIIALINGGENRENNLQAACGMCGGHKAKTREDVAEKSRVARKKAKHFGFTKPKALIPGSKGSGYRRKMDGTVVWVSE